MAIHLNSAITTSSDYLITSTAVVVSTPLTMACWFNADVIYGNGLISIGRDGDNNNNYKLEAITLNSAIYIEVDGGSYKAASSGTTWLPKKWNHACGIFYNTGSRAVFLNGGGKGTGTGSDAGVSSCDRTCIGILFDDTPATLLKGKISDVAIWATALCDNEVALIASSRTKRMPLQIKPNNLVGYWPLDTFPDGTVMTTASNKYLDFSGRGFHMTAVNSLNLSYNVAETGLSYPE